MPKAVLYLLLLFSLLAYISTGYFINRDQFLLLVGTYSGLFIVYFIVLKNIGQLNLPLMLMAALIFRFVLLFAVPVHSDDFYRFIWDGYVQTMNINPFDYTPRQLLEYYPNPYLQEIFPHLNSPDYFSVYPAVCQFVFKVSSFLGGTNTATTLITLKSIILLSEAGSVYMLFVLCGFCRKILIYALNPLVIIELTGNIHFEALMIFFMLGFILALRANFKLLSIPALALSIHAKLLPIIFLPLLRKELGSSKSLLYTSLIIVVTALLFLIDLDTLNRLENFSQSLKLYYGNFEFNGSIYLLVRSIAWHFFGFNPINVVSKLMIICTLVSWVYIIIKSRYLAEGMFWMLFAHLAFSAVVHPWYIAPLIALSVLYTNKFVLVWSALIPMTYISYTQLPYRENYYLVAAEYLITFCFLVLEIKRRKLKTISEPIVASKQRD